MRPKPQSQVLSAEAPDLALESGREVRVRKDASGGETLEVRGPGGEVELRVALTADGPVLRLEGPRIELSATDLLKLECRRFELAATEDVSIKAGGELTLESVEEMRVHVSDADFKVKSRIIWLN